MAGSFQTPHILPPWVIPVLVKHAVLFQQGARGFQPFQCQISLLQTSALAPTQTNPSVSGPLPSYGLAASFPTCQAVFAKGLLHNIWGRAAFLVQGLQVKYQVFWLFGIGDVEAAKGQNVQICAWLSAKLASILTNI